MDERSGRLDRVRVRYEPEVGVHSVYFPFDHEPVPVTFGNELPRLAQRPALPRQGIGEHLDVALPGIGPKEDVFQRDQHQLTVQVSQLGVSGREVLGVAEERVVG